MRHSVNPWMLVCVTACGGTVFGQVVSVEVTSSGTSGSSCYPPGSTVTMAVTVGEYRPAIVSGQFLLEYDPTCLSFVDLQPGSECDANSHFNQLSFVMVDDPIGTIFADIDSKIVGTGTSDDVALACLTFTKSSDCPQCQVCFSSTSPLSTFLTDVDGMTVEPLFDNGECSSSVRRAGDLVLSCPPSTTVNAACDSSSAAVAWSAPTAQDICDGDLMMQCSASHSGGENVDALITNGGDFPVGTTHISCMAGNSCGASDSCEWDVVVDEDVTLDLLVQLSPMITGNVIERCIEFTLYPDCVEEPIDLAFAMQFNLPGQPAGSATLSLSVPQAHYQCITAQDPLHTLRSVAVPECLSDGRWSAQFYGNPGSGGNWLVGGNLNRSSIIDILDFGVLVSKYLTLVDPNTTCAQAANPNYRHADVNGDGVVDIVELSFIMINFIETDQDACCGAGATALPITAIPTSELYLMGMGNLAAADLNGDGWVDLDDVTALQNGALPTPRKKNSGYVVDSPSAD